MVFLGVMSNLLDPISVELADVPVWMREALAIFRRRPALFLVISVVYFFICLKLRMSGYLTFMAGLVLCQVFLVIFIALARTVDESLPVSLNRCYEGLKNSVATTVVCGCLYVVMWIVAARLASMMVADDGLVSSTAPPAIDALQWLYPGTIGLFVVYIGVMITTMWFLLPLTVFHELGPVESVKLAKRGEQKNFLVVAAASYLPFFVFFAIFMFSELALVLAVAGLPMMGIYLYVSYRHVYLGKRENAPERVTSVVAETA
ncbi:hypothetical protein AB833_15340 [Chromatiales bacterium (ex Bugula neritina AB1)]|nr:hypothetical protein AB833_15340 [Chromatiales bacterium (ex Bugula neritina AB1)]